jgi:hypothetical protein
MAFNGTGTFVRLYNWATDENNSIPITASRMDDEFNGIATGLSNCITKDGQTTISANIPFNSKKITGLAVGSARTDSINVGQVQDGQFTYLGTTGGAADAYTLSPSPAITAYVVPMRFWVKVSATNATATPYLQISAIGTPASDAVIKKLAVNKSEVAVIAGDMVANGLYEFQRNSANTAWILLNPENPYQAFNTNISYLLLPITIANNATDANNDIDFSSGVFQFSDGSGQAKATALTKRLDASWVAGTNQGGLDTGSKANSTWYHCYAIYNPTTLVSDFLFSTGATTPTTLPSGYTKYKRVGSIKTDGSGNIRGFFQNGTYFFLKIPVLEFSGSSTTTAALVSLTTPLGIKATSILSTTVGTTPGSTRILRIFSPDATDAIPDASNTNGGYIQISGSTTDVYLGSGNILVPTNTSSQVYHRASASTTITVNTQGWIDNEIL